MLKHIKPDIIGNPQKILKSTISTKIDMVSSRLFYPFGISSARDYHRWELPGNYPVFTVVMVIYHYIERIWRIIFTPNFPYNIYDHKKILSR